MADQKKPPEDKPDNQGPPPSEGKARPDAELRAGKTAANRPESPVSPEPPAPTQAAAAPSAATPPGPTTPVSARPAAATAGDGKAGDSKDATRPAPGPTREDSVMARSTRPQSSWGSLFSAGLVGGAVVALAAGSAWITLKPGDDAGSPTAAKVSALELRVNDLAAKPAPAAQVPADLAGRLGRLEAAVAAASRQGAGDPALAARLAAVEAAVTRLTEQLARTDKRLEETAKAAPAGGVAAPAAPGVQPAELDAVAARVGTVGTQVGTVERNLAALQQQVTQRANAPVSDKAVRLAVLTSGLRTLVERGAPYATELAAAKQLVSDPQTFGPLEPFAAAGVPSALVLGRELSEVAPAMLKAGDLPAGEDYLERLQAQAEKLVRIRPVKDQPANDLAAQIGRAEAKARQADLAGALAELAKLPAPVRAPAEPWIKKAEARQAAVAAAQRVSTAALQALATP